MIKTKLKDLHPGDFFRIKDNVGYYWVVAEIYNKTHYLTLLVDESGNTIKEKLRKIETIVYVD